MRIENYGAYGMCIYLSKCTAKDLFRLGDVVINKENEIGVIIQIHDQFEYRTDMFGNTSNTEIRLATDAEIKEYRPNIEAEGTFNHD